MSARVIRFPIERARRRSASRELAEVISAVGAGLEYAEMFGLRAPGLLRFAGRVLVAYATAAADRVRAS